MPLPDDPERERLEKLRGEFLDLGFTESEATKLALAWALPDVVAWQLSRGCSHRQAVKIYT